MKTISTLVVAFLLIAGSVNQVSAHGWRSRCTFNSHRSYFGYARSYSNYSGSCNYSPSYSSYGAIPRYSSYSGYNAYPTCSAYSGYSSYPGYGVNSSYGAYPSYGVSPSYAVSPGYAVNRSYAPYGGGSPGPSMMNVLGSTGLGGVSTGQNTYMSLPVGMGSGQTGYLQIPVGNTAGRGSYLQIPVNSGYGPPTFMQIDLGRGSGDVLPNNSSPGITPPPSPAASYGTNTTLFDSLTSNILRSSSDDGPPVAAGSEQRAVAFASLSPRSAETMGISAGGDAGQYLFTNAPVISTSSATSFSLMPSNPVAATPSLISDDGVPWVAK